MLFSSPRALRAFTLLELLVVLAILATIAGGLLVAYDGLESQAAKGQATNTIASLDNSVRAFTVCQRSAPNDLDSMVAIDTPTDPGSSTSEQPLAILSANIGPKMTLGQLTQAQANALIAAGITRLRYIDVAGNSTTPGSYALSIPAADGTAATVGAINDADIPARVFDVPRPGSNRNRGRGASGPIELDAPVLFWNAGAGGIDNTKLGAGATDVLVAFGLGNNCTMMAEDPNTVGDVKLSSAPFYSDLPPDRYNRFVLLYNLGPAATPLTKAKLQAVVDARGDFLDEEFAEYTGVKQ